MNQTEFTSRYAMEKEKSVSIEHYPFKGGENRAILRYTISAQIRNLASEITSSEQEKAELQEYLMLHFILAESTFAFEEEVREMGDQFANLYYHGPDHAIYQTTFDAIYILRSLIKRGDICSKKLTKEGVVAAVIAACNHDTGYVTSSEVPCNYAARTPIHVRVGIENAKVALGKIKAPGFLDLDRVNKLTEMGIFATSFPFLEEHKNELKEKMADMTAPQRREAQIVRLAVQLADLGGQTARKDYSSRMIYLLREEMNSASPGSGDNIIGKDEEIENKSAGFMDYVVKPTVGKSAAALIGKENDFSKAWEDQKHPLLFALSR